MHGNKRTGKIVHDDSILGPHPDTVFVRGGILHDVDEAHLKRWMGRLLSTDLMRAKDTREMIDRRIADIEEKMEELGI